METLRFRFLANVLVAVTAFITFFMLFITLQEGNHWIFVAGFFSAIPFGAYLGREGVRFLGSRIEKSVVYLKNSRERWALFIIILSILLISDVIDNLAQTSLFAGDESQSAALGLGLISGVFFTFFVIMLAWIDRWEEENRNALFISR